MDESIRLDFFVRRLTFLIFIIALTEVAEEIYIFKLFWFRLDACTLEMVPSWAPAFTLVAALDPKRLLDDLTANTLLLFLVFVCFSTLDFFFTYFCFLFKRPLTLFFFPLVFSLVFLCLVNVLLLEVVKNYAFKIEGIEEGAFGKRLDMVWIDGADLEGVLSLLDHFAVFGDFCDFRVGWVNSFEEVVFIIHCFYGILYVLEVVLVVGVCLYQFNHFISLLHRHCQAEFQ